jgi:hypothetical protein
MPLLRRILHDPNLPLWIFFTTVFAVVIAHA